MWKKFKSKPAVSGHQRVHKENYSKLKDLEKITKKKECKYCARKIHVGNLKSHENVCKNNLHKKKNYNRKEFQENKYKKWYFNIIEKRNQYNPNGYSENHHIIPLSIGGIDEKENIVSLTAKEHFICHVLLTKMFETYTDEWYRMHYALNFMKCHNKHQERYITSILYSYYRENYSQSMSYSQRGVKNSQYGKIWMIDYENKNSFKINEKDEEYYLNLGYTKGIIIDWNKEINKETIKIKKENIKKEKENNKYLNALKIHNEFINTGLSLEKYSKNYSSVSSVALFNLFKKYGFSTKKILKFTTTSLELVPLELN